MLDHIHPADSPGLLLAVGARLLEGRPLLGLGQLLLLGLRAGRGRGGGCISGGRQGVTLLSTSRGWGEGAANKTVFRLVSKVSHQQWGRAVEKVTLRISKQ